jgi:hypothetical protein
MTGFTGNFLDKWENVNSSPFGMILEGWPQGGLVISGFGAAVKWAGRLDKAVDALSSERTLISSVENFKTAPAAEVFYQINRDIGQTVLFGQRRISDSFATIGSNAPDYIRGRTIYDVAADLRNGKITSDDILIKAFKFEDQLVTVNNRGLAALSLANLKPTNIIEVAPTVKILNRLTEEPLAGLKIPGQFTAVTPGPNNLQVKDIVSIPKW